MSSLKDIIDYEQMRGDIYRDALKSLLRHFLDIGDNAVACVIFDMMNNADAKVLAAMRKLAISSDGQANECKPIEKAEHGTSASELRHLDKDMTTWRTC